MISMNEKKCTLSKEAKQKLAVREPYAITELVVGLSAPKAVKLTETN
jgi:hypothetical protein